MKIPSARYGLENLFFPSCWKYLSMALYIFIAVVLIGFIAFGFYAASAQKKLAKKLEDFFASPPIKALLDSGFKKDVNGIYGRLQGYDIGLYVWFDPGNTRYFTYMFCETPGGWSFSSKFYDTYRASERIEKEQNTIRQELKQIDGDILAKSFARLLEVAAIENLKPATPRHESLVIEH
jgi:hypothetical protein